MYSSPQSATPPYSPNGNGFLPVLVVPVAIGASDIIIAALETTTATVPIETIRTWWEARGKRGKENMGDSGLDGAPDAEISRRARESSSPQERERYRREEKCGQ